MINNKDTSEYFQLRALKTAKVSEISETTASSPIPPRERVNFHIGNPVQDARLNSLYYELVSGLRDDQELEENLSGWTSDDEDILNLLRSAIEKSVPYMPRGGYLRSEPGKLIEYVKQWLTVDQPEPLQYDFGESSGIRECILVSGGIFENLRILFHSLDSYLKHIPAQVIAHCTDIPDALTSFKNLIFTVSDPNENRLIEQLNILFNKNTDTPVFLILGEKLSEITRREIRRICLSLPLFIIEINNTENHLSLAREAKLRDRVLRILSSEAILTDQINLPVSFIAGNSDFIRIIENVHFELKGTPPAAEVELFTYLLRKKGKKSAVISHSNPAVHIPGPDKISERVNNSVHIANRLAKTYTQKGKNFEDISTKVSLRNYQIGQRITRKISDISLNDDPMHGQNPADIVNKLIANLTNADHARDITDSFLSTFVSQHPEYTKSQSMVISGSSRTALSLLGFHCDLQKVIAPDLSWTYHHCFPKVITVPLTENLSLDINEILKTAYREFGDPGQSGAVVLNNPHNASGNVFEDETISILLKSLLQSKIYVIDDLSYENVAPSENLKNIKTLKQHALQLNKNGYLTSEELSYLITVHSLSKTDCFAGGRLAVIEIPEPQLFGRFQSLNDAIRPNIMAILLAYLFYRNDPNQIKNYWMLRNQIMNDRMLALEEAQKNLPSDRDPFQIRITRPTGSMYPHLIVKNLPMGMSLDWLSSGLARRGIGLIPLTTFSKTAKGYELAQKSFRLTLGGPVGRDELFRKTRRVLIDLNRLISEESGKYNLNTYVPRSVKNEPASYFSESKQNWAILSTKVHAISNELFIKRIQKFPGIASDNSLHDKFRNDFLPARLQIILKRFYDHIALISGTLSEINSDHSQKIIEILNSELYKENTTHRAHNFRHRLFDRTVHPTQSYALKVALIAEELIQKLLNNTFPDQKDISLICTALIDEYLGLNVPIRAVEEGNELVNDLKSLIMAEEYIRWHTDTAISPYLLSFWGDWDGSTRPSGQGHLLVSAVLLENVHELAELLKLMMRYETTIEIDADLMSEIQNLDTRTQKFWQLLHNINKLTNHLEKRYRSVLPHNFSASKYHRIATRFKIARDPLKVMWQHNDRLEKKMRDLRTQRRNSMEYYFALNKRLRKLLHENLSRFTSLFQYPEFAVKASQYRSLLRRFNLTPRIHQNLITSVDQFAIDTTVHNMLEINEISGKYGNPGMIFALQISMTDRPEALIALDRKIRSHRENIIREQPDLELPNIWLIPLFEDIDTVHQLESYLDRIWEYCIQSRRIDQKITDRFSEMICEIFIAGSDLSQQVSQPTASLLFKEAKLKTIKWLAEKGLAEKVRIKLGSGEPMQRQGGYFKALETKAPFIVNRNVKLRMDQHLSPSAQKSTEYAKSPLQGILSSGDLRTFQSNVFEKLKLSSTRERAGALYHIKKAQENYEQELYRISEPFLDTRLHFQERGYQELERLSFGQHDPVYDEFTSLVTQNFRQILYGSEEDVVGIHVISYFISRTTPILRDRPTVRPTRELAADQSQKIIERIAQTLPLSKHGTLLRAIGHNRAQSMILGINQLTSGLFRALDEFAKNQTTYYDGLSMIADRILPNLPVQEILFSLRLYHEPGQTYLKKMAKAFPASNSAFLYLREDLDSMDKFIYLLQMEFVRRHGLHIADFFEGNNFKPALLPALSPELAVLLQPDILNTSIATLKEHIGGKIDGKWLTEISPMLQLPDIIRKWRDHIWQMIEQPIFKQVKSFVELAQALNTLTAGNSSKDIPLSITPSKMFRMSSNLTSLLQGVRDDSMRQFLSSVVQYLRELPGTSEQIPINILRALEDIETIIKIEEQALSEEEQDLLRFYIIQIARLAGENG